MKKSAIVYHSTFPQTPVSFWAHRPVDAEVWAHATQFEPPLPRPVPGEGWAQLVVEYDGLELRFSSSAEFDQFVQVLSQNPLPTTRQLSLQHGTTAGPNSHWLSRLPGSAKSLKFRRALVAYLERVRPVDWG